MQYLWGAGRGYIDDIVLHREDNNVDGDFGDVGDEVYYHLTDPQFSNVVLINASATIVERVTYDAFGKARHHPAYDVDGDGARNFADNGIVNMIAGLSGRDR